MSSSHKSTPDQSAFLDQHSRPPQTKIVCSLRPSTDLQTIKHLLLSGMNVARIACAFGTQTELESLINRIRDASTLTKRLCGIILETHGTSAMVGPFLVTPQQSTNKPTQNSPNKSELKIDNNASVPHTHSIEDGYKEIAKTFQSTKVKSLQEMANTLNLSVEHLPQNLLQNIGFAMDNILNTDQTDPIQTEEKKETKTEIDHTNSEMIMSVDADLIKCQISEEKKTDDSLMLPLNNPSPRAHRSGTISMVDIGELENVSNQSNVCGHENVLRKNTLSYDGDNFVIQPDIYLIKQSTVRVITDRIVLGDRKKFSICFPGLCNKLTVGAHILIHPSIKLEIKSIEAGLNTLTCLVLFGGPLKEYSKVEFPSLKLSTLHSNNRITQQDVTDIGFGVQHFVDYICVSHCKSIKDINQTKEMLEFQTASIRNMRRNTSYDNGAIIAMHRTATDAPQILSENEHISNNIKILAKIEEYKCLEHISEIIRECDGIVIDHLSLLHSVAKNENTNSENIKERITEIVSDIILETRRQAKPVCICCEISTNVLINKKIFADLNLLKNAKNASHINVNIDTQSFLSLDDILNIEYCINFGADSICLLSDINRFKQIFTEYHNSNMGNPTNETLLNNGYAKTNEYDLLYLHGIIQSVSDIIKSKECEIIRSSNNYLTSSFQSMRQIKHSHCSSFKREINLAKDNGNDSESVSSVDSYSDSDEQRKIIEVESIFNSMASSAVKSAFDLKCSLIIVLTQSGRIARIVSKYRPHCTILAITDSEIIAKQCMFISGIFPVLVLNMNGTDSLISRALYIAYKYKLIKKKGDKIVVLAGTQSDILDEPCDFIMKLLYVDL